MMTILPGHMTVEVFVPHWPPTYGSSKFFLVAGLLYILMILANEVPNLYFFPTG